MSEKDYIKKHLLLKSIKTVAPNSNDEYSLSAYLAARAVYNDIKDIIEGATPADVTPVVHGRWIECDYKHLEHGFIETDANAGLYCSNCRTAFQKKNMTYKRHCPHCGAKMDEEAENEV